MDASGAPPPLLPLLLAAAVLLAAALGWLLAARSSKRGSARLPPGSTGLPLVGETLRLISAYKTPNPEPFIDDRVARHGSGVFTTHIFGERTVFSADPAFNRLLLAAEGRAVGCSYPSSIATLLGPHSLLLTRDPAHRRSGYASSEICLEIVNSFVGMFGGKHNPGARVVVGTVNSQISLDIGLD